jgi:cell filamentation protein, protein adenylyltransferase
MRHRGSYYRHLGGIREGNWEAWVSFFLEGVATIAAESVSTTQQLFALVTEDRARTLAAQTSSVSGLRLLELLPRRLIFTAKQATAALGSTKPTTQKAITLLEGLGVLVETTGRKRDRTYRYERYLEILGSGEG